jgi:hypothetical protein
MKHLKHINVTISFLILFFCIVNSGNCQSLFESLDQISNTSEKSQPQPILGPKTEKEPETGDQVLFF